MRNMLLAAAALVGAVTPTASLAGTNDSGRNSQLASGPQRTVGMHHRFHGCSVARRAGDGDLDRRGERLGCGVFEPFAWYGGGSTYDDRDWSAESGNDWWNDRPDRAYPRWMSRNQDCARRWYSGDVLTC